MYIFICYKMFLYSINRMNHWQKKNPETETVRDLTNFADFVQQQQHQQILFVRLLYISRLSDWAY